MVNPADLMARRARVAAELAKLDELLVALNAYATEFAPELLGAVPAKAERMVRLHIGGGAGKSAINSRTADAVEKEMRERNTPMSISDCERAVREAGVPVPDGDARNAIGVRLNRSGRFRANPGVGWWFADEPLPTTNEIAPEGAEETGAPKGNAESAPEVGQGGNPDLYAQPAQARH